MGAVRVAERRPARCLRPRRPAVILAYVTERSLTGMPNSYGALFATTFVVGLTMITLGPILDPVLKDLDIPLARGGLLSVAFSVGMLVGVLSLNFLLAKVPVKWGLTGAALVEAAGCLAAGLLARGLWSFFVAYFFVGLGCVFLNSLPGMWVTSHIKQGAERAVVILLVFFALGMMVGPLAIGGALAWGATWRGVLVVEAVICVLLAIAIAVSPISNIEGRENLRVRQLRDVITFNPRLFFAVLAASILYIGAEFTFNVWLVKFQIDVFGVEKSIANLAMTLFWVGLLVGRGVVLAVTGRFATSRILMVGASVWAVFAVGVALAVNLPMTVVMAFFAGLGASAGFPLILSFSARFPKWHAGVVFSAVIMAGALGRIVFPYLVGPLADSIGFRMAIGLAFLLAAMLALLTLYMYRVSGEAAERAAGRGGEGVAH